MIISLGTDWNRLVPSGSDRFRPVPTRFQLITSSSGRNQVGTGWNQVGTAWNRLEPTGSDRYLRGTAKYWEAHVISYTYLGLIELNPISMIDATCQAHQYNLRKRNVT